MVVCVHAYVFYLGRKGERERDEIKVTMNMINDITFSVKSVIS